MGHLAHLQTLPKNRQQTYHAGISILISFNPLLAKSNLQILRSNARQFYSSKGDPLGVKGLKSTISSSYFFLLIFSQDVFVHLWKNGLWTRLHISDKTSASFLGNTVFLVYYPKSEYIFISTIKAMHKQYIFQVNLLFYF